MFASLASYKSLLWPFGHMVRITGLEECVSQAGAHEWHIYAIRQRYRRPHVCMACSLLAKSLPREALVFETACGSGINLLWLGKKGFKTLRGADISPEAVALSALLASRLGLSIETWVDDSLRPRKVPQKIGGLLALNWLYHIPNASLDDLFGIYRPFMAAQGKIAFDVVDSSYNHAKNNQYHTDDFGLTANQRRPSEYTLRLSTQDVEQAAGRHRLDIIAHARVWGPVPRTVWLAQAV